MISSLLFRNYDLEIRSLLDESKSVKHFQYLGASCQSGDTTVPSTPIQVLKPTCCELYRRCSAYYFQVFQCWRFLIKCVGLSLRQHISNTQTNLLGRLALAKKKKHEKALVARNINQRNNNWYSTSSDRAMRIEGKPKGYYLAWTVDLSKHIKTCR